LIQTAGDIVEMKNPRARESPHPLLSDIPVSIDSGADSNDGVLTRERFKTFCLLAATAVIGWLCFRIAQPFLPALTWALALAAVGRPVHHWIAGKCRYAALSAGISVAVVAVLLAVPVAYLFYQIIAQAGEFANRVNGSDSPPGQGFLAAVLERNDWLKPAVGWIQKNADVEKDLIAFVGGITSTATTYVSGTIWVPPCSSSSGFSGDWRSQARRGSFSGPSP